MYVLHYCDFLLQRVKSFESQLLNATQQMRNVLTMIGKKDPQLREEIESYLLSIKNHTMPLSINHHLNNNTNVTSSTKQPSQRTTTLLDEGGNKSEDSH